MRKTSAGNIFSTSEVIEATGLTFRQIGWLEHTGVIMPSRDGHNRVWTEAEFLDCVLITALRRKGISLRRISGFLRPLQKELRKLGFDIYSGDDVLVCVEGKQARVLSAGVLIERMRESTFAWVLVSLRYELAKFLGKKAA